MATQTNYNILNHPPCRARLSDKQKVVLQRTGSLHEAMTLIGTLRKVHGSKYVASNFRTIEVINGTIRYHDDIGERDVILSWGDLGTTRHSTINYTICAAFIKGKLPNYRGRLDTLTVGLEGSSDTPNVPEVPEVAEADEEAEVTYGQTPTPEPATPTQNKYERLRERFYAIRSYTRTSTDVTDQISTGALVQGWKMLKVGIPEVAIVHALTINWSDSVRRANNIESYDPATYGEAIEGCHRMTPYVLALIEAGVNPMLVGPTQSGKSTLAKSVAKAKELPYASVPLTGGASPAWLLGRDSRNGYMKSEMVNSYENGGVFGYEEIDAADPNMLIVLNDAISSDSFHHPYLGEIAKHENHYPIALANTWGTGANAAHGGRVRMDSAVTERFRLGRLFVDYDEGMEETIMGTFIANDPESK